MTLAQDNPDVVAELGLADTATDRELVAAYTARYGVSETTAGVMLRGPVDDVVIVPDPPDAGR